MLWVKTSIARVKASTLSVEALTLVRDIAGPLAEESHATNAADCFAWLIEIARRPGERKHLLEKAVGSGVFSIGSRESGVITFQQVTLRWLSRGRAAS